MADLDQWVQDNYDAIVADPNRGVTYASLSESKDADLAAWARSRSSKKGVDVTPTEARADKPKEARAAK